MTENTSCSHCGAPLRHGLTGGVCQRCLLQAALQTREQEIREEVVKLTSLAERAAFIEGACSDDPSLADRMLAWLQSEPRSSTAGRTGCQPVPSGEPPDGTGGSVRAEDDARFAKGLSAVPIGGSPTGPGESPALPSQGIIDRYKLLQKIGEGGFGTVFLAEQTEPVKRRVALKIIKLGMDTRQVIARFEAERQTLTMMDHPNIAKVLDAGATESGRPYFVMELVRGVPITRYCDPNHLSIAQRLKLFVQVCQAIQHAHQKGVIHRDIKPSNILVADHDGIAVPKVIDFGIAKATQHELTDQTVLTQLHQFVGTPAYISPEQAALTSLDIDTRSDIYSLGVLLYELLTGSTPFDTKELAAAGLDEMRRIIREREPLRPSTKLEQIGAGELRGTSAQFRIHHPPSKIDRDLDWIVLKCLQKDRALRYATANGLATDVQRYLAHEPIAARPPSAFYRMSKLVRRNLVVASLGGLLFLALASAVVAGALMSLKIAKAKRESDLTNRRLSQTVRYLESQKMEELSMEGRHSRLLAWLANHLRKNPADHVAASRALSMLSLHNFALPALPPFVHGGPVNTAVFSPDHTQILTASDDGTMRFWDATNGRQLRVITNATGVQGAWYWTRSGQVIALTRDDVTRVYDISGRIFLFEISGAQVRSAGYAAKDWFYLPLQDHTLSRWDLRSGRRVEPTLQLPGRVLQIERSESGGWLAVACDDNTVHLIDTSTGEWLEPSRRFDSVVYLRATPDGRRLFISLNAGHRVAIWQIHSTNAISEFVPPAPNQTQGMHFTPDARRMVTFSWKTPPRIWDAETFKLLHEISWGAEIQGWTEYGISSDGRQVTGVTQNGMMRIWDIETGQPVLEPFEHQGWVRSMVFNSSNTHVLSASQDGTARVWDVRMREPAPFSLPISAGGSEASFNHAGTRLVVSVERDAVQVCDARTGNSVSPLLRHSGGREHTHIRAASFSQDDSRILTVGEEGIIRVWNATSYEVEHELPVRQSVNLAKFSPDDRFIVVGDRRGYATIWSTKSGLQIGAIPDDGEEVISLDFAPRGAAFVAGCVNGSARCYTLPEGKPASQPFQHRGIVWSVAYSPDGTRLVTASADRTARIWDSQSGQPLLKPLQHENDVRSARFSPDGNWILTTAEDGTARVWNARTAEPFSPVLRHSARVWVGAFSPDSRWVATGSDDRTARVWDPQTGLPISEPLWHTGSVVRLAFSPDGQRLLTFGGQARLWDVLHAPTRVPSWFCELVEAVGGSRLAPDGQVQPVSPAAIEALRKRFAASHESDFYARWAKWFLIDRMQDPTPPGPRE